MTNRMQWTLLLSNGRPRAARPPVNDGRSEFQRDYDRIIFSDSFRRLQRKTQVHPMPVNDHVHNRLTHSLEVACVGRSLGEAVGAFLLANKELPNGRSPSDVGAVVQAACLAHDIGNPPYGHAGEYAIRDWYSKKAADNGHIKGLDVNQTADLTTFEGNAQGLRILTQLEYNPYQGGMRLTYATLSAFCKYPWFSSTDQAKAKKKFSVYQAEREIFSDIAGRTGLIEVSTGVWSRNPLAYLVEAADDICYAIIDIEDGVELGLVSFEEYEQLLTPILDESGAKAYAETASLRTRERIAKLRGLAMEVLIQEAVKAFQGNYEPIMSGTFASDLTERMRAPAKACIAGAKDICPRKIFGYSRKLEIEMGAYASMGALLSYLYDAADHFFAVKDVKRLSFKDQRGFVLMGEKAPVPADDLYTCFMKITDFVSSLTDERASELSRQVMGVV